jgi:protein-disulfide isomerase
MSPEKEVSKRQLRREQIRKRAQNQRLVVIGLIVLGTLLIVVPIAYQMLKPAAEVVAIDPGTHPNANDNSMGATDAPIVIEEFSDFQCPYCKTFHDGTEPQLRQYYIDTGKVRFVYRSMGNFVSDNIARAYNRPAKTESQNAALAVYCAGDQDKRHICLRIIRMLRMYTLRCLSNRSPIWAGYDAFNSCYDSGISKISSGCRRWKAVGAGRARS